MVSDPADFDMYGKTIVLDIQDRYFRKTKYKFLCLNCNTEHEKEYRYKDKQHRCSSYREINNKREKWCFKCASWKVVNLFNKSKHVFGGYSKSCKACWSGYMKTAEEKRHKKVLSEVMSRRSASAAVAAAKSRAKRKGLPFNITPEYMVELFSKQSGLCYFSNIPMKREEGLQIYSPSIDKLDPDRGYVKDNVAWVIYGVNSFKQNLKESEFMALAKSITWRDNG